MVNKHPNGSISPLPEQLRAARAALGWSAQMLATKANLGVNTIRRAEEPGARLSDNNAERVVAVLREAGVEFVERDGVLGLALNFLSV